MSANLLNRSTVREAFSVLLDTGDLAPLISSVSFENSTNVESQRYGFTSAIPRPVREGGPQITNRVTGRKIDVVNVPWSMEEAIQLDDFRRDQTGQMNKRLGGMAEGFNSFKWERIVDILNNGHTSGVYPAYDGQSFFSTSHQIDKSPTQKNIVTSSEVAALNIATVTANVAYPTPEEFVDAIVNSCMYMYGFKDGANRAMNRTAKSFLVVVPWQLAGAATIAMTANFLASGKTNPVKAANDGGGFNIEVRAEPELTVLDTFFVLRRDGADRRPFIFQEEVPVTVDFLGEGSEHAIKTKEVLLSARWVGAAAPAEPLHALKCVLS